MEVMDIVTLVIVLIPSYLYLYLWIKKDLENKSGSTLYDKKGRKVSNFGDWLDGKEK